MNKSIRSACGKVKTDPDFAPYAKVQFRWIVGLNLSKVTKVLEDSTENAFMTSWFANASYNIYFKKNTTFIDWMY